MVGLLHLAPVDYTGVPLRPIAGLPPPSGTHRCDCAQSVLKVMSSHDHVKYVGEPGPVQIDARSPGLGCVRVCSTYRSGEYDRCSARPVGASAGCTRRGVGSCNASVARL